MTRHIAIVLFDGAEELDWAGPWEVFTMLAQVEEGSCEVCTVSEHGGEVRCAKGLRVLADHSFDACPKSDILVIPGGQGTRVEDKNRAMLDFVRRMDATTEVTSSVCTGAFVLESAGLLTGKRATTHWGSIERLRARGTVEVLEDTRFVDEGHIVTAAGVSAGIDMSLHLVGRLWSPEVARRVQKAMEYFPEPPYGDVAVG
ncbi:MAG TPA: DJ-1/PfpI family protein [Tepidiformaceae bacterium]|nr:DJ-1/PfpI family protein [Tepidiformaceae bacterium]